MNLLLGILGAPAGSNSASFTGSGLECFNTIIGGVGTYGESGWLAKAEIKYSKEAANAAAVDHDNFWWIKTIKVCYKVKSGVLSFDIIATTTRLEQLLEARDGADAEADAMDV